jgi:hypothetical protein
LRPKGEGDDERPEREMQRGGRVQGAYQPPETMRIVVVQRRRGFGNVRW